MADEIQTQQIGRVFLITLNRPDKKNAFNNVAWHAFSDAIEEAKNNDKVAAIVITGAGGHFSSGVDLSDFGPEGEVAFLRASQAVIDLDKPLLAAADGVAIGGGATLLFHCDVVYVGENLKMRLPFVNLGLVPEWGSSYMLQANIGAQKAAELFYTAEWINAARAVETGISVRQYSSESLLEKTLEKAAEIAQWPVNSLRETKRCLKLPHTEALKAATKLELEGMKRQAGSPENIEAVTAFFEKRAPNFD